MSSYKLSSTRKFIRSKLNCKKSNNNSRKEFNKHKNEKFNWWLKKQNFRADRTETKYSFLKYK